MASIKLVRLGAQDNLSIWAEKTNSIINVVEDFILNSGSIITRQTPANTHMIVWDSTNSEFNNKTLIGPIIIDTTYSSTTQFKFKPQNELITDLTEKSVATGNDYVMIYDSVGLTLKKAKISAIQTSQAAAGSDTQVQYNQSGSFAASAGLTFNYASNLLSVSGGLAVGTTKLVVSTSTNNVGIGVASPSYALDVSGNVNISSGNSYRINGTTVLNATSLGSGVVSSSLQSLGTLSSLTVSGTTSLQGATTVSSTLTANSISSSGTISGNILQATTSATIPTLYTTDATASVHIDVGQKAWIFKTYMDLISDSADTTDPNSYFILFTRDITTGVTVNKILGTIYFRGKDSTAGLQNGAAIVSTAEGTFTSTSSPASIRFLTTPSGTISPVERLRIFPSGSLTIGTSPSTERTLLYVQGTVNAGDSAISSSTVNININGTGNRSATLALYTDATYSPGFSISRSNAGANATLTFLHRGTGAVSFTNQESATFSFLTSNTTRFQISDTQITSNVLVVSSSGGRFGNTTIAANGIELAETGTGDRDCAIDFHSESITYTDYDFRIIRSSGANGNVTLLNRGSGFFDINCYDPSSNFRIYTNNTLRMLIDSAGKTTVYGTLEVV